MSYKTVTFGSVMDQLWRGLGFDPDNVTPTANEQLRNAELLGHVLETGWQAYLWPRVLVVSKRRYRPDWDATANYLTGEEVWRSSGTFEHYCRAKSNNSGVDPATDTSETYWDSDPADFIPHVELDQWWETQEIDGYDLNECAMAKDPLTCLNPGFVRGVMEWEESLLMPPDAPSAVYLRFRPTKPLFSGTNWTDATSYAVGDLAYRAGTKECYKALLPSTNKVPENETSYWIPVGFPEFLVRYCVLAAVAETQSEDSGKYKTQAQANEELERLMDVHGGRSGHASRMIIKRYRRG
jgi:hypothetical protein